MSKKVPKNDIIINGINIDEWIEESQSINEIADESGSTTLKYEKKLVAFLDLLGITHEIRSNTNGNENIIISKMTKIKEIVEIEIEDSPISDKMSMLYISDSFIFVCEQDALANFLALLSNIQMRVLVECKTMLRGALEYGDVIVQDNGKQIIGPAYIDAYQKQEHDAIFPRIIIGNSVLGLINSNEEQYEQIVVSQDRETSLDYIDVYMTLEHLTKKDIVTRLRREGIYDYLFSAYEQYNQKNNSSVRAKYAWTINYLRDKGVWSNEKRYNNW